MAKAKAAGQFLGGIFNNPGIVILGALAIALLFFQKDIRNAFGSLGEGFGNINIELPEFKFPEFTFPEIKFPEFKFPDFEFPDINIDLPDFNAIFAGFQEQIDKGLAGIVPQVEPERMDVPFPTEQDPSKTIDIVPDVTGGRGDRLRDVIDKMVVDITNPKGLVGDIAKAIVPETQVEFQERAAGLVETFPDVFRSTSLTDEISFGRQLSRESEDFESVLAAEARRSEEIFAKLFGNVQNPNF